MNYDCVTRSSQMTCCPSCQLQVVVPQESVLLAVPRCQVWPMISGYDRLIQYQKMTNTWYFHATLLEQLRQIFCWSLFSPFHFGDLERNERWMRPTKKVTDELQYILHCYSDINCTNHIWHILSDHVANERNTETFYQPVNCLLEVAAWWWLVASIFPMRWHWPVVRRCGFLNAF